MKSIGIYLQIKLPCLLRQKKARDANLYGLPLVTTENCKNFQFSTDYGKLEFFYGNFLKNSNQKCYQKSAKLETMISNGVEFLTSIVF